MSKFDVIVVGLGGMGSAAAAHAAARGRRVLGLEQFQVGHDQGSSHGRSRVIRLAYFEDPAYVPLLLRAYELWRRLEQDTGRRLLEMTGGLMIGSPDSEVVAGSLRSAREHALEHEMLDAREIHRRFPALTPRSGEVALFEHAAGVVFPEEAIRAHLDVAVDHGAHVHFDERVDDWSVTANDTVIVRTSRGVYECDRLILAPGAWASQLFKIDWLPLEVEPRQLHWFRPKRKAADFVMDRFPIFIWDLGDGTQFYGCGADETSGVKVAFFRTKAHGERVLREVLRNRIPALAEGSVVARAACKYTLTPDRHFVVGLHPQFENVAIASPCSGHGFKFATAIGEVLADLVDGGKRRCQPLFDPLRFRSRR